MLDVYQTLLDLSDLEKRVNELLNSRRGYALWFEMFMEYLFVENSLGQFNDFTEIGKATMQMAGKKLGVAVKVEQAEDVIELLKHIPLRASVPDGLSRLTAIGIPLAALTNAPWKIVSDRMERTGLVSYFEKVLTADQFRKYKPSAAIYQWAANQMQLTTSEIMMVSVHGWDIAGANHAGMQTAFIEEEGTLYPLAPYPTIMCSSLTDLAEELELMEL